MKPTLLVFIILGTALLSACGSQSAPSTSGEVVGEKVSVTGGEYTNISVAELQTMLEDKDFLFVNVHIPFSGDIPDTDISIPFDQIQQNLDLLPAELDAQVVIYCRSGSMSGVSATELVELGYTNIWNLEGGFNAWEQANLPMEK